MKAFFVGLWANPKVRAAASVIATAVVGALAENLLHLVNAAGTAASVVTP